jgi:2-polyprenyl-6-methoxyphenol hydroxylase-like FAD-dependent oxidoreductase
LKKNENDIVSWVICPECQGFGFKKRRINKSRKQNYQIALDKFENGESDIKPLPLKAPIYACSNCDGSGLIASNVFPIPDKNLPHLAIIGAGIGGVALAIACLHRKIPFTLFERDNSFDERSQGYGLTLQQASKAIEGLGIFSLKEGVVSTKHVVHTTNGEIIGEWGMRKWLETNHEKIPKRTNIHISRQKLRSSLIEQLDPNNNIQWGHQLVKIEEIDDTTQKLSFQLNGEIITTTANLVVGADGIRSTVRNLLINEKQTPLRYLGCIVILGICPLNVLASLNNPLLDSATVFQTANGNERIYVMPFDSENVMWQLSFPMLENEATLLSSKGSQELKKEAIKRINWHEPIPQIIGGTPVELISGYPVYDRELLSAKLLQNAKNCTLIGDAAHPMSPFKGQGANQALLDAISLARLISKECNSKSSWKEVGLRNKVLNDFETEMLQRSAIKVKDSEKAAQFLHSDVVLQKANQPRGRNLK